MLYPTGRALPPRLLLPLAPVLIALCLLGSACTNPTGPRTLAITYDPCDAVVTLAPDAPAGTTADVESALAMWQRVAGTRLTLDPVQGAPRIPIEFADAAPLFHGIYEDTIGVVLINRSVFPGHRRAVTIAHELGHAMGLFHVDPKVRLSVMNPGNWTTEPTPADADAVYRLWRRCDARTPLPITVPLP